ncbi:hypothetical protein RAS1_07490 [Phycisphaerae bacterium RAS1]|nr:hypothetical protein RAS1_07490 [Phycisphaerae bacterium RAS1]
MECVRARKPSGHEVTRPAMDRGTPSKAEKGLMLPKRICVGSIMFSLAILMAGCPQVPDDDGNSGGGSSSSGSSTSGGSGGSSGSGGGGGNSAGGSSGGASSSNSSLAAPSSPSPTNGARGVRLEPDALGGRSIVELDWAPVNGASRYVVNISRSPSIPSDAVDEDWSARPGNETGGTSASDYTFIITSASYRYSTTYYWRVTAYNADRTRSVQGPIWSFTTESSGSGNASGGSGSGSSSGGGSGGGSSSGSGSGGSGGDSGGGTRFSNIGQGSYSGSMELEVRAYLGGTVFDTETFTVPANISFNSSGQPLKNGQVVTTSTSWVSSGMHFRVTSVNSRNGGELVTISYDVSIPSENLEGAGWESFLRSSTSAGLVIRQQYDVSGSTPDGEVRQVGGGSGRVDP